MVNWQLNKERDKIRKFFHIGTPIGLIVIVLLSYGLMSPFFDLLGFIIPVILTLGGCIGFVVGIYLGWKYIFSKNPKYIGISKNGVHFSNIKDDSEDCIKWKDILGINISKTTQRWEYKVLVLKMRDGTKRKLDRFNKEDIDRIIHGYEKYKN
jgi:hypothetical protein